MILDMHTHVFPDAIAHAAIASLEEKGGVKARTDGTLRGLLSSMENAGVDCSLVLPVVTKPSQFESVNRFAALVDQTPGLRSLGGIHPKCEDVEEKLSFIASLGLRGVKLHPDYQGADIEDEGYLRILEGCKKRGMIVVIHAGLDPAYPAHIHCPPQRSAPVIRAVTGKDEPFIVLAHMGGVAQADLVEEHLVGAPVYLDCSFVLDTLPQSQFLRIVRAHGPGRVLFGTDSPWKDPAEYLAYFRTLPLTAREREAILWGNGARLLGLRHL